MTNAVTIDLASGRTVSLERLIIEDIYTGVTAGSPEELRQILIDIPLERVQALDDEDAPFHDRSAGRRHAAVRRHRRA